ncbi:hypothetical protein BU23DRAFT_162615 [Bimuria novae-zelandiae CBS 107.79]|uniref:Uncharacterized protein n=1 Tax=Bimuria novae-zelandiae CBS 107.79 TaxID=1447943 RepID=A0A6A5VBI9_9PLEO|nr:hypothetical protein BU23DRAFT_162615 [Bimuria novae-zelandiae CBS 107.79]
MKLYGAIILSILPAVLGYGEKCDYYDGTKYGTVSGICGSPAECLGDAFGYTVNNQCPGGSDNKCCITKTCKANGKSGYCTTVSNCNSNEFLGGHHVANKCPGPDNVQCCY